ncbi:retrotransposon protein, putative, ty1-copia subclass [Tanacetum coccineum]
MFEEQEKQELFEIVKAFHACKQEVGQSVRSYLLKTKSYLDNLECLSYAMPNELGVSFILNSLNKEYDQFVQNYNMHSTGKTIAKLHAMLKLHEKGAKGKDKGKNKLAYALKPKIPHSPKRDNPTKDSICHHCKEVGHWRRNCPSYQAELKKRKEASMASTSGISTIELYAFPIRLGHINKKCMDKLHRDGILQSSHDESLEKSRILNMVPTKKVERTPYEIWHGKAPKLSYLRVWGCEALVNRDAPEKLNARSIKCIFVGYPKETMGYYFYYPPENKIFVAQNVEFFEDNLIIQEASGNIRVIRILLAIATFYDYEIWQMDAKTAFLNGHLSEDVYMVQPEGFDEEIKKIGFTQNPNEPCVYLKASGSNVAFLILYVDDILLMGNSVTMLQEFKSWLCKCYSMKDSGEAAYILGIKIIRDRSKLLIALGQSAYLEKILKKFRMENSKKGYTLMMEKLDYRKSQGAKIPSEVQRMQRVTYASAIGSLMYAVRCTRPDVAFAQNLAVDWKSARQSTTAMSFTEAEYIAAAEASMEAIWMRKFIDGLGDVVPSNKRPMEMLCDNEPAIAIAADLGILKGVRNFQRGNITTFMKLSRTW